MSCSISVRRYKGHVLRYDQNDPAKRCSDYKLQEAEPRLRPAINYVGTVESEKI